MIKKLEKKVTLILMSIFSILLVGVLVSINILNYTRSMEKYKLSIEKILEDNGEKNFILNNKKDNGHIKERFQDGNNNDNIFRLSQFYSVKVDFENEIISITNDNTGGYSNENIESYTKYILEQNNNSGKVEHLLYKVKDTDYGKMIVFLDNSIMEENVQNLLKYSFAFGFLGLIILFLISYWLSKWILRPVLESLKKQKQFISDASHELKTPLTVIGANADILEGDIGENKWLKYIQNEVVLMNSLVNKLLTLAKVETIDNKSLYHKLNFSKLVIGASMPFESMAFEKKILLSYEVKDNINIIGDEYELKQLVGILIDNALRYTEEGGEVIVSLDKHINKIILRVINRGEEISVKDRDKVFERFYRVDEARSRNNSYGLGLAIAKAIVEKHNGTINIECDEGWTKFIILL